MSVSGFPELAELLPHAEPMLLLSRVLSHEPELTVCELETDASELFRDSRGRLPGWLALEWMAQCIAAHGGLIARASGRNPSPGMLVGAKRIEFERFDFDPGETLEVEARFTGSAGALATFACALRRGRDSVASGSLSVYVSGALATQIGARG